MTSKKTLPPSLRMDEFIETISRVESEAGLNYWTKTVRRHLPGDDGIQHRKAIRNRRNTLLTTVDPIDNNVEEVRASKVTKTLEPKPNPVRRMTEIEKENSMPNKDTETTINYAYQDETAEVCTNMISVKRQMKSMGHEPFEEKGDRAYYEIPINEVFGSVKKVKRVSTRAPLDHDQKVERVFRLRRGKIVASKGGKALTKKEEEALRVAAEATVTAKEEREAEEDDEPEEEVQPKRSNRSRRAKTTAVVEEPEEDEEEEDDVEPEEEDEDEDEDDVEDEEDEEPVATTRRKPARK